jgi:hypothetical protein
MDQGIMTLITVGVVLGLAAFVLWLLYTVIWHGVRRGMQEFAYARVAAAQAMDAAPAAAASTPTAPAAVHEHHHHLLRRVPADVVPDYLPSDWV